MKTSPNVPAYDLPTHFYRLERAPILTSPSHSYPLQQIAGDQLATFVAKAQESDAPLVGRPRYYVLGPTEVGFFPVPDGEYDVVFQYVEPPREW